LPASLVVADEQPQFIVQPAHNRPRRVGRSQKRVPGCQHEVGDARFGQPTSAALRSSPPRRTFLAGNAATLAHSARYAIVARFCPRDPMEAIASGGEQGRGSLFDDFPACPPDNRRWEEWHNCLQCDHKVFKSRPDWPLPTGQLVAQPLETDSCLCDTSPPCAGASSFP
jgi:hypothetical protein